MDGIKPCLKFHMASSMDASFLECTGRPPTDVRDIWALVFLNPPSRLQRSSVPSTEAVVMGSNFVNYVADITEPQPTLDRLFEP